jgi:hypothetical protein
VILNALPQNYKNIVQIMTTLDMFSFIENLSSKLISKKNNKETLISESLGILSKKWNDGTQVLPSWSIPPKGWFSWNILWPQHWICHLWDVLGKDKDEDVETS